MPERYVAVVPDRHGTGTNALVLSPPDAIRPAFGEGSRDRHVAAAREAGIPFAVEELPSLALDLDTPADLVALATRARIRARRGQADRPRAGDLSAAGEISVLAVSGIGEIGEGDRIGAEIAAGPQLEEGDVVVVSQKVVSKAEGRVRRLSSVIPGGEARRLAAVLGKEPALVELILEESAEVIRAERGVLITETPQGWVCANAGIDSSNIPAEDSVSLLPEDAGRLGAADPGRDRSRRPAWRRR